jgi:hypothetical protein
MHFYAGMVSPSKGKVSRLRWLVLQTVSSTAILISSSCIFVTQTARNLRPRSVFYAVTVLICDVWFSHYFLWYCPWGALWNQNVNVKAVTKQ